MNNQMKHNKSVLSMECIHSITGGNSGYFWAREAIKILIAYWGSIKLGFADGYNDYLQEQ